MKYKLKDQATQTVDLYEFLKERGVQEPELYMTPNSTCEEDNSYFDNMESCLSLIKLHATEKIALIVDCDQDGYTSAAILYLYLTTNNICSDITPLFHEGKQHGLEYMTDIIKKDNYSLALIPDAGSNDWLEVAELRDNGIDVIILDHHDIYDKYTYSICDNVINNQASNYPNKSLSGAGVVWKFCKFCDEYFNINTADSYLDLAAIGIIGDMMDISTLENRWIIERGLSNITNPFFYALIQKQSFSIKDCSYPTPTEISFYITPLVNALIRVGTEKEKSLLFQAIINGEEKISSTKRGHTAEEKETIIEQILRNCVNARARQNKKRDEALALLVARIEQEDLKKNSIIIVEVESKEVEQSIRGLVAMQLNVLYNRPVCVVCEDDEGYLKGSARARQTKLLKDFKQFLLDSNYFEYAEGHAMAFGLSINKNLIPSFIEYANNMLGDISTEPNFFMVDRIYKYPNLENCFQAIINFGSAKHIWGKGMEEPLIVVENIPFSWNETYVIGSKKNTLKFTIDGIEFIKFFATDAINELKNYKSGILTIIGTASINEWYGKKTPQIVINDFNIQVNSVFDF